MKNLKMLTWFFILLLTPMAVINAQVDPPVDVTAVLSDQEIDAANERIVKCFSQIAEGEVIITSINDNVILIKDEEELLINEQVQSTEFVNAIDLPNGHYVLIITSKDKKVTREVEKTKTTNPKIN